MRFRRDDGGREAAGFRGLSGDCVTRSIAIATGQEYRVVYDELNALARTERLTKRHPKLSSARNGVYRRTYESYLLKRGWVWVPTMGIGTGCQIHLDEGELPDGRLIVSLSRHVTAVINGVLHDTYDCSRNGTRCVYGYYFNPNDADTPAQAQIGITTKK